MSFFKNIASSCLGASVAILVAGSLLIFIFVGALIGGLAEAFSFSMEEEQIVVSKANTVIQIDMSTPIAERSSNEASFSLNGFDSN